MRIVYDEHGFSESHGGVSRLFTEVMRNLPPDMEAVLTPEATRNSYLSAEPFSVPSPKQTVHDFIKTTLRGRSFPGVSHVYKILARFFPAKFPSMELANERSRRRIYRAGVFDIAHLTVPHPYDRYWKSLVGCKPIVATVVDLIPELVKGERRVKIWRRKLLEDATHIIAITEKTKSDVVSLYGIDPKKITVVYLGANMKPTVGESSALVRGKFVLFIGKRGGYKNFNWMVSALAPMLRDGLTLFCTGGAFTEEEKALFARFGVADRVKQKFVSDEEMNWLFAHAECFIHPSLYEGFGIPILDAFAAGCPALIANASCFPEVAGDAALYFDPKDITDFRAKFAQVQMPTIRQALIAKGRERLKFFSWQKCADETAAVYRKVVAEWK